MNTKKKTTAKFIATAGVAGALVLAGATAANAHITISQPDAAAGSYALIDFGVPHGCDGSATTKVSITIPQEINAVTPQRNAFYTINKVMEPLPTPIKDSHGKELTERVKTVEFTATTPLPNDQRDALQLQFKVPDDAAGKTLYFPTVQTCEKGETAWTEMPQEGQTAAHPSPKIKITEKKAGGDEHAGHDHSAMAGHGHSAPAAGTQSQGHDHAAAEGHNHEEKSDNGQTPLAIASLGVGGLGLLLAIISLGIIGRRKK